MYLYGLAGLADNVLAVAVISGVAACCTVISKGKLFLAGLFKRIIDSNFVARRCGPAYEHLVQLGDSYSGSAVKIGIRQVNEYNLGVVLLGFALEVAQLEGIKSGLLGEGNVINLLVAVLGGDGEGLGGILHVGDIVVGGDKHSFQIGCAAQFSVIVGGAGSNDLIVYAKCLDDFNCVLRIVKLRADHALQPGALDRLQGGVAALGLHCQVHKELELGGALHVALVVGDDGLYVVGIGAHAEAVHVLLGLVKAQVRHGGLQLLINAAEHSNGVVLHLYHTSAKAGRESPSLFEAGRYGIGVLGRVPGGTISIYGNIVPGIISSKRHGSVLHGCHRGEGARDHRGDHQYGQKRRE